jgi:hypothetical protein
VLFEKRFWAGITDGSITSTFRRWKRPQALAGKRYRTPGGLIEVQSIVVVHASEITSADALGSGYSSARDLVADLRGTPDSPIYRIRFHHVDDPDPRDELARDDALSDDDVEAIRVRLERMDRLSSSGPWTMEVLRAIAERPGVRAADLAQSFDRELAPFKLDVRKLKNLGLTISLEVGYRLSPRGEAVAERLGILPPN